MDVQHGKVVLRGIVQRLSPVGHALVPRRVDHPLEDGGAHLPEDQHAAGRVMLLHDPVNGLDEGGDVERVRPLQRLPEFLHQLILDALQEGKAVPVMGVKGSPVQLRQRADLLDRDLVDGLFPQQRKQGFLEHPLGISYPGVCPFHSAPPLHKKFSKLIDTVLPDVGYVSDQAKLTVEPAP